MSTTRLSRKLTVRSSGNCETPSTGTPLTVSRCSPETRIWKYEGTILNCTISRSHRFASPTISPFTQLTSASITISIPCSWKIVPMSE
jgi:hypothetical protein